MENAEIAALQVVAAERGIPVEGLSAIYAEIKEHIRLKDAVVEVASLLYRAEEAYNAKLPFERPASLFTKVEKAKRNLDSATYLLLQFEEDHK